MPNTIRIHSFPLSGYGHRVELFASVAGINYEVINVDVQGGEHKSAAYLAKNPMGQVPVIEDGDTTLYDSNAILVYLARKYAPAFIPNDPLQEAQVQKVLSLVAGELAFGSAAARMINLFNAPLDKAFAHAQATKFFKQLDAHLDGRCWLVGDGPTIADIAIYSYTAHAPEGGISLAPYPNIRRLLLNIQGLEGFVPMQSTPIGLYAH